MSTLKDVAEFRVIVWQACELHGSTDEFQEEFATRFRELGETIRFEGGLTYEEAIRELNFSPQTKLGSRAEAQFQELEDWVYSLRPFSAA